MCLMYDLLRVSLIVFILTLCGCAAPAPQMTRVGVDNLIADAGYVSIAQVAGGLPVLRVVKSAVQSPPALLRVYLEGDGLSWRTRRQLSAQPSPINPLALRLMLTDPSDNTAYIARPCQFVQDGSCVPRLWSRARFSADIINSVSATLDQLKKDCGCRSFELVGYSGGAAVALLLAAQRDDVEQVITVCGNLDSDLFCQLHHVSPLSASLNPLKCAARLRTVPQIHFLGADDAVIPFAIYASYRDAVEEDASVEMLSVRIVAGADHHHGWVERWPLLLKQM